MPASQKLSTLQGDEEWLPYKYPAHFALEQTSAGTSRLVVGVLDGGPALFARLVGCLAAPYLLLYVLHTPRGEGEPGRYQSPPVTSEEFHAFVERFGSYLTADARFDLWAHSPEEQATVVWDRHNLLYGYGTLERMVGELHTLGFIEGAVKVPVPHAHNYRPECDQAAKEMLEAFSWSVTPLRPEDEQ